MIDKATMPHTTVGMDPSGSYVVLVEGGAVPEWFSLDGDEVKSESDGPKPPPKSGPNSSAKAWAEYAAVVGVDVADGAKQGEIVAALDAAGKPTE